MTLRKIVLSLALGAGLLGAQEAPGRTDLTILPYPSPRVDELKQYLALSDAQVQQLNDVAKAKSDAAQAIWRQIMEKQQQLSALLEAGSTDASRIGTLMVEINNLNRQVRNSNDSTYRTQALAVLTAEQKTKLVALDSALKLQTTAYQAVHLNLLDQPQPHILPAGRFADGGAISSSLVP